MNLHTPLLMQYEKLHAILSKDLGFGIRDQDAVFSKTGGGLEPATANSTVCRCTLVFFSWVTSCLTNPARVEMFRLGGEYRSNPSRFLAHLQYLVHNWELHT